jgi:hypothetical protein
MGMDIYPFFGYVPTYAYEQNRRTQEYLHDHMYDA